MLSEEKYSIKFLDWDTNFFGIKSAKIYLYDELCNDDIKKIKEIVKEKGYEFITIQNCGNIEQNNVLMANFEGAFLADVNIQFEKKLDRSKKIENKENVCIKEKYEKDENIVNIAKKAFTDSRFLIDSKLRRGNEVYVQWVSNSFEKQNKFFCTYREDKKTKGFILFSIEKDKKSIFLELIAVDKDSKSKGIGTSLIKQLENFAIENKIEYIRVGTQLNNLNAQNFYEKNGFKHIMNNSIYHWWINNNNSKELI